MTQFALVLPVFFAILFGIVDACRAIYAYDFTSWAAREATRYAIVHASSNPDLQAYVTQLAAGLDANSNCSGSTATPGALCATATWTPDHKPGSLVTVTVIYNFKYLGPFVPAAVITLSSTSAMVVTQ